MDDAFDYLRIAMQLPDDGNIYHMWTVNDRCRKYSDLEKIIMQARAHALADSSELAEVSGSGFSVPSSEKHYPEIVT